MDAEKNYILLSKELAKNPFGVEETLKMVNSNGGLKGQINYYCTHMLHMKNFGIPDDIKSTEGRMHYMHSMTHNVNLNEAQKEFAENFLYKIFRQAEIGNQKFMRLVLAGELARHHKSIPAETLIFAADKIIQNNTYPKYDFKKMLTDLEVLKKNLSAELTPAARDDDVYNRIDEYRWFDEESEIRVK